MVIVTFIFKLKITFNRDIMNMFLHVINRKKIDYFATFIDKFKIPKGCSGFFEFIGSLLSLLVFKNI